MRYAICNKAKSVQAGISLLGHKVNKDRILLNEREIMINQNLSGTTEERVSQLDGVLYSETQVINIIKSENWK